MTGLELKVRRTAARVKAYKLAERMGVASPRVSQIEALAEVSPETEQRYLSALAECEVDTQPAVEAGGGA